MEDSAQREEPVGQAAVERGATFATEERGAIDEYGRAIPPPGLVRSRLSRREGDRGDNRSDTRARRDSDRHDRSRSRERDVSDKWNGRKLSLSGRQGGDRRGGNRRDRDEGRSYRDGDGDGGRDRDARDEGLYRDGGNGDGGGNRRDRDEGRAFRDGGRRGSGGGGDGQSQDTYAPSPDIFHNARRLNMDAAALRLADDLDARQEIWRNHLHLRQNSAIYDTTIPICDGLRVFTDDSTWSRQLLPTDPRQTYRRRKSEYKSVNHWGQRKLLMSEIEFLSLYAASGDWVIYAGAAPGNHLNYLADMFPDLSFLGVDPSPFNARNVPFEEHDPRWARREELGQPAKRVECQQRFFTDADCELFKNRTDIVFISDVRTADWKVMTEDEVEKAVYDDQNMQMRWVEQMNPRFSMLKFRLPWGDGETEYLDGEVFLPVWGPITTTETRLVTRQGAARRMWNNRLYEEQLFYFNTVTRVSYYGHDVAAAGLCHCFDCASEVRILRAYLGRTYSVSDGLELGARDLYAPEVAEHIAQMIAEIEREISHGRRLCSVMAHPAVRRPWFEGRRFDAEHGVVISVNEKIGLAKKRSGRDGDDGYRKPITVILASAAPESASTVAGDNGTATNSDSAPRAAVQDLAVAAQQHDGPVDVVTSGSAAGKDLALTAAANNAELDGLPGASADAAFVSGLKKRRRDDDDDDGGQPLRRRRSPGTSEA